MRVAGRDWGEINRRRRGYSVLGKRFDHIHQPLEGIGLISTDVFDTLLLRQPLSQRSRIMQGERRFAQFLRQQGYRVGAEHLFRARQLAEKLAYRALNVGGGVGEVKLFDIVTRQLIMLGLPQSMVEKRLALEIMIEKASLSANGELAKMLRQQRKAGIRVVAVSDTGLPTGLLKELIDYFHGPGLIDKIYSSAEVGASKRHGSLFSVVLSQEKTAPDKMLHIGDDYIADCEVPTRMGINAMHLPKGRFKRWAARADGARMETIRRVGHHLVRSQGRVPDLDDRTAFGREVFGPIVAQFCLNIWLYASQAEARDDATLLFCARGGLGIREAFERLLARLDLPLGIRRENIMVSRLVAARVALIRRSPAVLDELGREFETRSFADVANALGSRRYELPAVWQDKFEAHRFFSMLETPEGRMIIDDVARQSDLFVRHLKTIAGDASRIVLCDTGLYGSTQRLLAAGLPERAFETIQFARSNYKGLSEEHFHQVSGLVVENNLYNPLKVETVVLRYWQIIESLFEPAIPSVRHFSEADDGSVRSNAGETAYGILDAAAGNLLLTGVLQYIDRLRTGSQVMRDVDIAWPHLKRAITYPGAFDMQALAVGARSVDFGRPESVHVLHRSDAPDFARRVTSLRSQLWREGAIARDFPRLKSALLPALELVHIVRGVSARLNR
ncbi:hydrolase [Neorhizobium petrolearium]|uniref:Hydrolase n=1 Tax=Neorhizobium petrolearium TaxID=515361 RepID=A0ABY8LV88_9HYPH|nr:hydrolase [Neorhizobium petrolearium]MCC2611022.1 hydrolase [Neorhizobium petrolearium]WGI66239.1 hydrolase [Neorhizobium petrolearium]